MRYPGAGRASRVNAARAPESPQTGEALAPDARRAPRVRQLYRTTVTSIRAPSFFGLLPRARATLQEPGQDVGTLSSSGSTVTPSGSPARATSDVSSSARTAAHQRIRSVRPPPQVAAQQRKNGAAGHQGTLVRQPALRARVTSRAVMSERSDKHLLSEIIYCWVLSAGKCEDGGHGGGDGEIRDRGVRLRAQRVLAREGHGQPHQKGV